MKVAKQTINLPLLRRIGQFSVRYRWAADGSGPGIGARVVGLVNAGAWAELVAVLHIRQEGGNR